MIKISWDKNTLILSELNAIVRTLIDCNIPYKLITLGKVKGMGLNDDDNTYYLVRKLEYKDKIILERMERDYDCDLDDIICSYRFQKNKEPKNWEIEIEITKERRGNKCLKK